MSKRVAFLQATSRESVETFLNFINLHKSPSDPFNLDELLQELPRKQKEELWEKLKILLTETLVAHPLEEWQKLDADSDDDMEVECPSDLKHTLSILYGVTVVATKSVSVVDEDVSYGALLECAAILNGIIHAVPQSENVCLAIQHLCEAWWQKGLEGKEEFGKTAFIFHLSKSLEEKGLVANIVRLWNLHPCLLSFDYNSAESNEVKELLLLCARSVKFIKNEEGRRFITFLFSWDAKFVKVIHARIKGFLQFLQKSLMKNIAEIYFRAWKKASGDFLKTIENDCIQDFMHHGVHLPKRSPVYCRVREVLAYFHQNKLRQGVDEMLCRLYQPILWRGIKAINSEVRANSAVLFVEVFPFRYPGLNHEDMDNEIQKQFDELFSLLEDPHPIVRSAGVLGVCKISAKYWEMMPVAILTDLLKKILCDLACDTSSADVRCSVFKCLPIILENSLSHPLLEKLLPAVRLSLHDNSEKVRVAFVNMLLKIKAVRAAKFWNICPMDHLLARLEVDSRPVSRRIVNLLFNSFFPVNQDEELWCERCVSLVQMNPAASRKFYQYAHEHTAATNIAKLMFTIRRCLNGCIQRADQDEDDEDCGEQESEKENKSVLDNVLSTEDSSSVASLLEIIVILWRSIRKTLDDNKEAKEYTITKFAKVLPQYFRTFKDERCVAPLVIMASFMPAEAVPTFSHSVLSKLRKLECGVDEKRFSSLIDCLCRWNRVWDVLELITEWLSESLPEKKSRKHSGRQVRILETSEPKPTLALDYLEYIVKNSVNREYLLSLQKTKLSQLLKVLGLVKEVLCSFVKPSQTVTHKIDEAAALRIFSLYCRLSVHLQHKFNSEGSTYLSVLEDTGEWIHTNILTNLESNPNASEEEIRISQEVLKVYLTVCKDVLMVGLGDSEFKAQLLEIIMLMLQTDKFPDCVPMQLSLIKETTEVCLAHIMSEKNENINQILDAVQNVFHKVLETIARRLKKQQEEILQLIRSIQAPLGEFINCVQCWHMACPELHRGILSTIMAAVVVEISHRLRKVTDLSELTAPDTISDLPPLSRCLMSVMVKSHRLLNSFLGSLTDCVVSEEVEGVLGLSASLYIAFVSRKGNRIPPAVKDLASAIYRKLKNFGEVTMDDAESKERAVYELSMKILDELQIQ
ncbi:condensin-2 complex subunit G2 [Pelobates fuscus]|uniref:condensin-2 complex subunit G2 n=1 Tax=Pelobates fuscus TaxID=191477 RepID=UPI002FE4D252